MKPTTKAIRHFLSFGSVAAVSAATVPLPSLPLVSSKDAATLSTSTPDMDVPPGMTEGAHPKRSDAVPVDFIGTNNNENDEAPNQLKNFLNEELLKPEDSGSSNNNIDINIDTDTHTKNTEGTADTSEATSDVSSTPRKPKRCRPDVGVLACDKAGESCVAVTNDDTDNKDNENTDTDPGSNDDGKTTHFYCVPDHGGDGDAALDATKVSPDEWNSESSRRRYLWQQQQQRALQQTVVTPSMFQNMPPPGTGTTGEVYAFCKENFVYETYSTPPDNPSSYDACICDGYNFALPDPTYSKDGYCKAIIVPNFCAYYFPPDDASIAASGPEQEARQLDYDTCVCTLAKDGNHPGEEDADFCKVLPVRYCVERFPEGNAAETCLCDLFLQSCPGDETTPPTVAPTEAPSNAPTVSVTDTTTAGTTVAATSSGTSSGTLSGTVDAPTSADIDFESDYQSANLREPTPFGSHPLHPGFSVASKRGSSASPTFGRAAPLLLPTTAAAVLIAWTVVGDLL